MKIVLKNGEEFDVTFSRNFKEGEGVRIQISGEEFIFDGENLVSIDMMKKRNY